MSDTAVTKLEQQQAAPVSDPMVSMIERVVLNPDADLDKLERMLAMKERMDAQNARVQFARALSAARAEIPPILKDATVDFETKAGRTTYRHETLAGIAKVIDPILSDHCLSYRFRTDQGQGGVKVTCIVTHGDGHFEETSLSGAPDGSGSKNSFQAVGSAVTYLQRYTLKAALGLSAELDDDGQGAAPRSGQQKPAGVPHEAIRTAIGSISNAENMSQLRAIWSDLPSNLKSVPGVLSAKDQRKGEMEGAAEPQGKPVNYGEVLADEIPY